MPVISHSDLPIHQVPRIKTRVLNSKEHGAQSTAVWEQWIDADGHIPLHYHDVEEVLLFLTGQVSFTADCQTSLVSSPATVVVPAGQIHGLRPAGSSQVHLLAFFPTASPVIYATDGSVRPLPWEDHESSEVPP